MRYRKKPVVIEAWQVTDEWFDDDHSFGPLGHITRSFVVDPSLKRLDIQTLEGIMAARVGDWIIKGIKGELYPCKPDIFEATYEPVDEKE